MIQHLHIYIYRGMIPTIILVIFCNHTILIQYCWLYSPAIFYIPRTYLFYNQKFVLVDLLHPFHGPQAYNFPLANTNMFSVSVRQHINKCKLCNSKNDQLESEHTVNALCINNTTFIPQPSLISSQPMTRLLMKCFSQCHVSMIH